MKRSLSLAVAIAAAALAAPASAGLPHQVTVDDDFYDPDLLKFDTGEAVNWASVGGGTAAEHTVTQDRHLFDSSTPSTNFTITVAPSAGTFPYHCEIHGAAMTGTIKVAPTFASMVSARRAGAVAEVVWAAGATDTGNQFDVQYKVGNGEWKYWKKNTSQPGGEFGKQGKPVSIKDGKTYRVRARSEKSFNPKKRHSEWSPALKFSTDI
jgi:plastocyanin